MCACTLACMHARMARLIKPGREEGEEEEEERAGFQLQPPTKTTEPHNCEKKKTFPSIQFRGRHSSVQQHLTFPDLDTCHHMYTPDKMSNITQEKTSVYRIRSTQM